MTHLVKLTAAFRHERPFCESYLQTGLGIQEYFIMPGVQDVFIFRRTGVIVKLLQDQRYNVSQFLKMGLKMPSIKTTNKNVMSCPEMPLSL